MENISLKKGIFCIILSCFFFSLMSVLVKLSMSSLIMIETIFLRCFFAFLILIPIVYLNKKPFKTNYFKLHFFRSFIGTLGMLCMFFALSKLPISNVIIISFSKIFFVIPLAMFFLKEKISLMSLVLICFGFFGVAIAIGIDSYFENLHFYLFAFTGAFLIASVKIIIKKIAMNEDTIQIQFWFAILSTSFLLAPYLSVISIPSFYDILIVFFSAIFGLLAQYFTITGLRQAAATKILPFDFFRVIFGIFFGVIIFSESITSNIIIGSTIILLSSLLLIKKS